MMRWGLLLLGCGCATTMEMRQGDRPGGVVQYLIGSEGRDEALASMSRACGDFTIVREWDSEDAANDPGTEPAARETPPPAFTGGTAGMSLMQQTNLPKNPAPRSHAKSIHNIEFDCVR